MDYHFNKTLHSFEELKSFIGKPLFFSCLNNEGYGLCLIKHVTSVTRDEHHNDIIIVDGTHRVYTVDPLLEVSSRNSTLYLFEPYLTEGTVRTLTETEFELYRRLTLKSRCLRTNHTEVVLASTPS